jgi:hypothetical protein
MVLTGINQLWIADITYIRLEVEFVYLAVLLDAFSRSCIGWALPGSLEAGLVLEALRMALRQRRPQLSAIGAIYVSCSSDIRPLVVNLATVTVATIYHRTRVCGPGFSTIQLSLRTCPRVDIPPSMEGSLPRPKGQLSTRSWEARSPRRCAIAYCWIDEIGGHTLPKGIRP